MAKISRKRIISAFLAFIVIGLSLLYLLRTVAADLVITHMLARTGFSNPSLNVDTISQQGLGLSDVRLGKNGEIRIARLDIDYNPTELRKKSQVRNIRLTKPYLQLSYEEGRGDVSALSPLLAGESSGELPFASLEADGGMVNFQMEKFDRKIEDISLKVKRKPEMTASLDLSASIAEGSITASATPSTTDFSGTYIISAETLSLPYIARTAEAFGLNLPATPHGKADIDAEILYNPPQASIAFRAGIPDFIASEENLSTEGSITADGQLNIEKDGNISPSFSVSLTGGLFEIFDPDITFAGIESMVTINSLTPIATLPGQEINFERAHIGRLKVTEGNLLFHLQPDDSFHIDSFEARHGKGRIWLKETTLTPPFKDITLSLHLEALDLSSLLDLAPGGYISGEGTIHGTIPLQINIPAEGGSVEVNVGRVELYSDPGEGYLRINREGEVSQYLAESNPALKERTMAEIKTNMLDILVDALQEYHFKSLRIESQNTGSGLVPRAHIVAHEDQAGQAVRISTLTINLRGLDSLLSQAIIVKESGVNMRVDRSLDKLLDFNQ